MCENELEVKALGYLDTYAKKNTINSYKKGLKTYFEVVYGQRDLSLADRYISDGREYEKDMESFFVRIKDRPPKSIKLLLSTVRVFLMENDVELPDKFWKKLNRRINGRGAVSNDRPPEDNELKTIFNHLDLKGTTFFAIVISSGMRCGEALQIELDDLDLTKTPARINLRAETTKSGERRTVFISDEAKQLIEVWLTQRMKYIENSANKGLEAVRFHGVEPKMKSTDDPRLFPFSYPNANCMWTIALRKARLADKDRRTQRKFLHIHTLRKYFRTQMATKIPVDIVEALMGHEGYLTEVYRRYTTEQLADFYKKAEETVTIFMEKADTSQFDSALSLLSARNSKLEDELKTQKDLLNATILKVQELITQLHTQDLVIDDLQREEEHEVAESEVSQVQV